MGCLRRRIGGPEEQEAEEEGGGEGMNVCSSGGARVDFYIYVHVGAAMSLVVDRNEAKWKERERKKKIKRAITL